MSFFGFDPSDLEQEKRNFLDGGSGGNQFSEDVAVYSWGEESYDGLGDALQEGGDDLNDETFGGTGAVGKDFDFSKPALPGAQSFTKKPVQHEDDYQPQPTHLPKQSRGNQTATPQSLESIWDEKSPLSVLPHLNGSSVIRTLDRQRTPSSRAPQGTSQMSSNQPPALGSQQGGIRTLQEIEAEMRLKAQQVREAAIRQQQQQQLLQQQQEQEYLLRREQEYLQQQREQELLMQKKEMLHQRHQELRQQQHIQQQLALQQQQQRTPPPRILPVSQSPRFQENQHQRQILLLQQQQELQQQQRLVELQEQLRLEELERQFKAQQISQLGQGPSHFVDHRRHPSGLSLAELQAAQVLQLQGRGRSPAFVDQNPLQSQTQLPQNVQLQQRLLSDLAQANLIQEMHGASQAEQETLRAEAMRKIMEAEMMEEKRRRKAAKIAHMSRYNDLMTQSDKDFITRIQVSQLVTQDPYAEDFYAQVYLAIMRSRQGLQYQDERVLKFGSSGGVGLGLAQKGGGRRPSAMQRMEAQVERIVSNARLREKEKGIHSLHSLHGALGKTSGRSYKAAPRQLLQVESTDSSASPTLSHAAAHISKSDAAGEGAAKEAAKLGREALGNSANTTGLVRKDPLTHREVLVILESLYDQVLRVEQLRRDRPSDDQTEAFVEWESAYSSLVNELWDGLRVMVPLETSNPHPFISLLMPAKGKRLLPRVCRHLSAQQMLTTLTLLVACFNQLDTVKLAPLFDSVEESKEQQEAERQTQAFLGSVVQSILPVVASASLRLVSGLLGLFLDRCDIVVATRSRPGLALLTLFLSRVEVIKQSIATIADPKDLPSAEEAQQWQMMLDHLFQLITPHLLMLFPSNRLAPYLDSTNQAHISIDTIDQPVWQFLAALALHSSPEQQQTLVATLREKVLENVMNANTNWLGEDERQAKLSNVNLFLHALGLDSSQIAM